ncbi:extracellular solute-binding protein [Actibacterium ureilyticum]|uniref:extracellular solute-binding protein n=1 Tax=Actibacterium ureilyticum TaxID=1590614 RepID=UPI000BAAD6F5
MCLKTNARRAARIVAIWVILFQGFAAAEPMHGIAMYGKPALPPDFTALPYANPDAPTGGRIVTGEVGSFDSLNPHILKGRVPWQLRFLAYESLMGRSYDEPFTLYGLLAETIETGPNREWVEFTLRPEARFSDGTPVTVEDVLWSYETLGTVGHPRYHGAWKRVTRAEQTGERSVRFTFAEPDRELALIIGMRPILKKAQWEGTDFAQSGLNQIPITTAPYVIDGFEAGRHVTLRRNPDYWGKDLPFRRGTNNLDEIRMEFFGDANVMFEAFKAGEITTNRETSSAAWNDNYNFPAVRSGAVVKSEIPHQRPSGIWGFVMNTRRAPFGDWRVRSALIHLFNFEFINDTLNDGALPRVTSYYANSVLAMRPGPAEGRVRELLAPFADTLPPGALDGYALPVSDGSLRNRRNVRKALDLFQQAGFTINDRGQLQTPAGKPLRFEILLKQSQTEYGRIVDIYIDALTRAGITPVFTTVDSAQYKERTDAYDFDMTFYERGLSLSPGNEQKLYWGREGVTEPGTLNWMGMDSPAAEAMIDAILQAQTNADFVAAARALDRVLTTGRYVIPIWYQPVARIAHVKQLRYPERIPIYGDFIGFQPDVWWYEE